MGTKTGKSLIPRGGVAIFFVSAVLIVIVMALIAIIDDEKRHATIIPLGSTNTMVQTYLAMTLTAKP